MRWIVLLAVLAALGTQAAAGAQPPAVGNQRVLVVLATWGPQPFTREDVASAFADAARFYDKSSFHQVRAERGRDAVAPGVHRGARVPRRSR